MNVGCMVVLLLWCVLKYVVFFGRLRSVWLCYVVKRICTMSCIQKTTNALWLLFVLHLLNDPLPFVCFKNWNVVHLVPFTFHTLTWTSAKNRKDKIHLFFFIVFSFLYALKSPLYPVFKFYKKNYSWPISYVLLMIIIN